MERLKAIYRKRAVKWTLRILVGLVALWTVVGFLVLPPIIRHVAAKNATEALGRKVEIAQVRLNPYALSVTVRGLRVNEREGTETFFSVGEIYVNASAKSLFKLAPVITEVRVVKPYFHVVREEDGSFNFSDLANRPAPQAPPPKTQKTPKPFLFSVSNIRLTGGEVALEDKLLRKSHRLSDIELSVPSVSNFPGFINTDVQPYFAAALDGSPIRLAGTSKPFAKSLETRVTLNLKDIDLPHYVEYVPVTPPLRVPSGKLTVHAELTYLQSQGQAPALTLWSDVSLTQFQLNDAAGAQVLSLPEFRIEGFSAHPLLDRFYCAKVFIGKPDLSVARDAQGRINLLSLLPAGGPKPAAPPPKPAKPSEPLTVEVGRIELAAAKVTFTDMANRRPFTTTLSPIDLDVLHLSVSPGKQTAYKFGLATESGETVSLEGAFTVAPPAVHGGLRIAGLVLGKYAPYYEERTLFDVEDGRLDLGCRYSVNAASAAPDVKLSEIGVTLKSLRLRQRDEKEPFLTLPLLALRGGSVDLSKHEAALDEVYTEGLSARVARFKNGELSLQKLVPPLPAPAPATQASPWQATIRRFEIKDYAVRWHDEVPATPVNMALDKIGIKAGNLTTAPGAQMTFDLGFRLDAGATLATTGAFCLQPPSAKLHCDLKQLNLASFQPYAPDSTTVALRSGLLSFGGDAAFEKPASGVKATYKGTLSLEKFAASDKRAGEGLVQFDAFRLSGIEAAYAAAKTTFKADLAIEKFALIDKRVGETLAQFDALRLSAIAADYAPLKLSIGEVSLDNPGAQIVIGADGTNNVTSLFAQPQARKSAAVTPQPAPAESAPAAGPAPEVRVGQVTLHGGRFSFLDRSVTPAYSVALAAVDGKVEGISLDPNQTAQVNLSARLDDAAPLVMTGKLRPARDNLLVDLHADFSDIELSPATPYANKYIGYPITKGKLTLGLDYVIQGRKLSSKNRVHLDQFTLGDHVENSTATHAPVKLALALLRDRHGAIKLDLPVSGSLDDPKFRLLPVLVQVLENLVLKAATSPFSLVASLVGGGGGEEMSYVEFDYGSAALDATAQKKLEGIVKLLDDRPALRLEMQPQLDPQRDTEALRRQFMERKLKIQKLRDTVKKAEKAVEINQVTIEPQEYEKYLTAAYEAEDIPEKPRNVLGAKSVPPEKMEELLLAHTTVAPDDLRLLAYRRAASIRDALLDSKAVAADRLFITEPREAAGGEGAKPRTQFALALGGQGAPPPTAKAFEPPPVTGQSSDTVKVKPR